jgi:hypothetical protein
VALAITVIALWATRPPPTCDMTLEPHSHLNLDRTVDREHLAADIAASGRIAERYSTQTSARPVDPRRLPSGPPGAEAEQCHARLAQQIMATHDLTLAQILTATRSPG